MIFVANQRKMNVVIEGSGPALLLVHGFPLDHTMWRHQIDHFRKSRQVIAPDLIGYGLSEVDARDTVSMRDYADDLALLIQSLELAQPITYCGLSMGGYVGWQLLKHHPGLVDRLIMTNTRSAGDDPRTARGRRLVAEQVTKYGVGEIASHMPLKLLGSTASSELAVNLRQVIANTSPQTVAAAHRGMAIRPDMTPMLSSIDVPTLLVCGSEDEITPPDEMSGLTEHFPNATYLEIAGSGHMTPLESPIEFNRAVESFLREFP